MKKLGLLFFLVSCASKSLHVHTDLKFISIMQGPTSETQTSISIVVPQNLKVKVSFHDSNGGEIDSSITDLNIHTENDSPFEVRNYFLTKLNTSQTYTVIVTSAFNINDKRTFKTLKNKKGDFRALIGSCMSDTHNDIGDIIWPNVFKNEPEALFLIGDNIYSDVYGGLYLGVASTPEHLWSRYIESRIKYSLYHQDHLTPIYALWDDHDYGINDGNKHYKHKKKALEYFNIFFARHETDNYKLGPGASSYLKMRNKNYYFLDGRYFRDVVNGKSHLGKKQTNWLYSNLKKNEGDNFLVKGDQFFGGYHNHESFEGNHKTQFKKFISNVAKLSKKTAFISGDRHFYELAEIEKEQLGHKTYEFTSSAMHARVFIGSQLKEPNKRRIGGKDGVYHYMLLDIKEGSPLNIKMRVFDKDNKTLDSKNLTI
jgi:alkaline phosphatase D